MDTVWWRMDSVFARKRTGAPARHPRPQRSQPAQPSTSKSLGRRELSVGDLEALGLGVTVRPYTDRSNEPVRRVYCLSCGVQIDDASRGQGDGWAHCPQGCSDPLPELRASE